MSKGIHRGKPMEARLMSDRFSVGVVFTDAPNAFPMKIEEVYFNSEGSKEVMASEHFYIIQRSHEPVFVESGYGDYVFAFKKKKKVFYGGRT